MTSLSGSSDSRNSSCAMTTLATSSSISLPRNTMRSLSSRENRSQPRSPRCVCSTTVGTSEPRISGAYLGGAVCSWRLRRRQPRDQRVAREPPGVPQLPPGQLAGLRHRRGRPPPRSGGTRRLRGVHHLGRIVGLERIRAARRPCIADIDGDLVRRQRCPARPGRGGCRDRRISRPARRPGPSCASPAPRRRGAACRPRWRAAGRTAPPRAASSWTYPKDI